MGGGSFNRWGMLVSIGFHLFSPKKSQITQPHWALQSALCTSPPAVTGLMQGKKSHILPYVYSTSYKSLIVPRIELLLIFFRFISPDVFSLKSAACPPGRKTRLRLLIPFINHTFMSTVNSWWTRHAEVVFLKLNMKTFINLYGTDVRCVHLHELLGILTHKHLLQFHPHAGTWLHRGWQRVCHCVRRWEGSSWQAVIRHERLTHLDDCRGMWRADCTCMTAMTRLKKLTMCLAAAAACAC